MTTRSSFLLLFILLTASWSTQAQSSSVYFYRLKNIYLSNTDCIIAVNDTGKVTLGNGTYQLITTNAESLNMVTAMNNTGIKNLKLEKDKTYYIEAEVGLTTVNLTLKDAFTGKPAIERLETEKKVKNINEAEMKNVKVTSVEPLPAVSEKYATVYLFRPFNVAGLTIHTKISDGASIYEMKNNSSHVILYDDKNEITFTTVNEGTNTSNTSLKLNLEKGKVYYVAVLRTGGAIVLTETKEDYAKKEMKL